jgi:hypothetical protein
MALTMAVCYRKPDDPDTFEKRYVEEHLPLVRSYNNIGETRFLKVSRTIMGDFPYAYLFIGTWQEKDGWKADMNSEAAKKATDNAKEIAPPFDVVVFEQLA